MIRRLLFTATTTVAILVLFASSALAHFCYVADRSVRGAQQAAANSASWVSVAEFLAEAGMCAEGIAYVDGQVAAATGTEPGQLAINERTVMAQGHGRSGKNLHLASNGRGVDWLSEEDFAMFDTWVGTGFGICAGA